MVSVCRVAEGTCHDATDDSRRRDAGRRHRPAMTGTMPLQQFRSRAGLHGTWFSGDQFRQNGGWVIVGGQRPPAKAEAPQGMMHDDLSFTIED